MFLSKEEIQESLDEKIQLVKEFLAKRNVNIPFFLCGGSVFSSLSNTQYDDIDVYFYQKSDYDKVHATKDIDFSSNNKKIVTETCVHEDTLGNLLICEATEGNGKMIDTPNAINGLTECGKQLQFIHKNFGEPSDIINDFDLNCSKVAYTFDGMLFKATDFGNEIEMDFKHFKTNSFDRYFKYIEQKKAVDPGFKTRRKILNFIIDNAFTEIPPCYNSEETRNGISILCSVIYRIRNINAKVELRDESETQYIHDRIVEVHTDEDKIEIFNSVQFALESRSKIGNTINPCPEMILAGVKGGFKYRDEHKNAAIRKYPEYFI